MLGSRPVVIDSPTQHRIHGTAHLDEAFAAGRRRPEWTWVGHDAGGQIVGAVALLGSTDGTPLVLDWYSLPADPRQADGLIEHATRAVRSLGVTEAGIFGEGGSTLTDPGSAGAR